MAVITTVSLIMEAGSRGSLIAARRLTRSRLRRSIALNVSLAVLLAGAVAALAGPAVRTFAAHGNPDAVRVLSLNLVVTALSIAPMALLQKALLFKRITVVRLSSYGVAAIAGILVAALGGGVWALVVRQVLAQGMVAALAWIAARRLVPERETALVAPAAGLERRADPTSFAILAAANFLALGIDTLIVGSQTNASRLGLYTFAFTLGFAPLTQFAWQIGQVFFPAAAASTMETVARRAVRSTRLTALLMLPVVPAAIVLAPVLLPLLGEKWRGAVAPFQFLLLAGTLHAVVNSIGESLGGSGHAAYRARVAVPWALGTAGAVLIGVQLDGVRGAAVAHLVFVGPLVASYAVGGMRRLGSSARDLWSSLRPVVVPVVLEGILTAAVAVVLRAAGASEAAAAVVAAVAGLGLAAALLRRGEDAPLREAVSLLRTRRA
jgi:PST family polysaccharide transporter